MPSTERDTSRDSDRYLKHQHSASSDGGRALVPMWDSSDPERAPPPLPMNPSSPIVAASRPNTSSAIQSAHAALTEKARENTYTISAPPRRIDTSPERSLIKGAAHKRMQSLQTGHVRDLSNFLEGGSLNSSPKSPEKHSTRPSSPHFKDFMLEAKSPEKSPERSPEKDTTSRSATPTPSREPPNNDVSKVRPSLRRPPQSILGENTPPQSATMLALQNMACKDLDTPLSNVTNGCTALVRTPQTFDAISNQILSLTRIATNLQREMANLSRRSKDNATDLVSLKEATNARDEDIRRSLRELVSSLSEPNSRVSSNIYGIGAHYLDNKPHNSPGSRNVKPFTLPRIPSPNTFAASLDRESLSTPSSYIGESAASIALLEKILREMGTKEGQDLLVLRLTEISEQLSREGMSTAKKLDDLVQFIKNNNTSQDLAAQNSGDSVRGRPRNFSFEEPPRLELDFDQQPRSGPMMQRVEALLGPGKNKENLRPGPASRGGSELLNEDILKIIRSVKDSVAQGGGLTAEVKALVRELRGEVLGMGREIGRKLDEVNIKNASGKDASADKEEVARVVQDGLEELKQHMDHILRENRRQSSSSSVSRNTVDYQEIYNAMRAAIQEKDKLSKKPGLEKEDIIEAVKEAWENYKPDIEVQHFGLEREELLSCLKEGIQEYAPQETSREITGATREEVFQAVVEGLKHFSPPRVETEASMSREEILDAVRECLEEFEFPAAPPPEPREPDITRDDMLDAVKEGLHAFDFPANTKSTSRDIPDGLTRDDVLDAVNEGLHTFDFPINANATTRDISEGLTREDVLKALNEALNKFDFAANASNTTALTRAFDSGPTRDDMFQAVKECLHTFDFGANLNGPAREHILEAVTEGLQNFDFGANTNGPAREDILEAVREGLEAFDIGTSTNGPVREDILEAVRDGLLTFDFAANADLPTRDDILEAVKEGLHGFDFASNANATSRDEIVYAVREGLHGFALPPNETSATREQILEAVKEGLHSFDFAANASNTTALTRDIGGALTRDDLFDAVRAGLGEAPPLDAFAEQVLERLQEIMDSMRIEFRAVSDEAKQNVAAHGRDTEQLLDATKDGFEKLRADIETYVDHAADVTSKDAILDSMRESFDSLRAEVEVLVSKGSNNSLEAVQSEFEHLRETMATAFVRGGGSSDKDEILDALREGLDGVRADIERPRGSNESVLSGTGEILDALHDGLAGLRAEVEKVASFLNKPVDMTVNYEILDTLKAGLEGVRADIDRLAENGHGERAVAEISDGAVIAAESLKRNDIENLEVLITQLRIKVEALESMPQPHPEPVPGSISRDDLAGIEEMLRTVQDSVTDMSGRDRSVEENGITKEDFEAIETLLRNTKAMIDEMDPEQAVKKDHLDAVEAIITETRDGVTSLGAHLLDVTKRDDVNIVEALVRDVLAGLEEMKERVTSAEDDAEKVTKTDVEAVEAVCLDVKSAIEQMLLADIAALASKDDVKNLGELVKEFKNRIETHADSNAKAFEERQAETVGVGERVSEIKTFLEEFKDAMKEKLDEGATSVEALGKFLESLGETVGQNANMTDDIKTLAGTIKEEFEKSNAGVVGVKIESDEKFQKTWDNFDTMVSSLDTKLEEKFIEIMTKYDDAQIAAEAKAKLGEEKNAETEAALLGTKAVAEELKSVIETLGTTMTESVEKMDEASKTVFSRVDDTFTRVEETHADAKAEHQLTREQVFKTVSAIEGVHGHVTEYNPKILEAIKDVLLIVGQHYEHSKESTTTIQEKIADIPAPAPPVEIPMLPEIRTPEKYDDTQIHEKLDKLVDHMHVAGKSFAQLDMLDKIHQQVKQTASEVSEFVSAQTQRIANDHEDKEKAVEAATIALEKRIAQKESVEATVVGLREEEDQLKESVSILRAEQEDLAHQKMRLSADVSSLETALRIRREELHAMEARAEGLERRILEGVIDHSRALLISKSNKGRDAMSRKRVPSHATSTTGSISSYATSRASNHTQSAVSMAMNGNRGPITVPINNPAGASRRILSLNQITNNVPTGGSAFIKRSHSVKTPSGALRKSSWGGSLSQKYGDLNKENLALKESEEEDKHHSSDGEVSESGTMRRSSRGTTILTSTGVGDSVIDEGTEWTGSMDGDGDHREEFESEVEGPQQVVLYEEGGQLS